MKLGILTSIFGNYNFEQVLDMTSEFGLECMEVACWPQGEGERRYAGVAILIVKILQMKKHILS